MIPVREVARPLHTVVVVAAVLVLLSALRTRLAGPPDVRTLSAAQAEAFHNTSPAPLVFAGDYPDTLTLFLDYRCGYCAAIYPDLVRPDAPYGIVVRHVAPDRNTLSAQAAVAAECARRQGRFHAFSYALLARRDSIGLLSWEAFGRLAGVPSLEALTACTEARATIARIDADLNLSQRLDLTMTPVALYRGRLYFGPVRIGEIRRVQAGGTGGGQLAGPGG